jgi:epoxide hydrolase-like predicted phosphatase
MRPMIKAIIFDWGGVLMRTEDTSPRQRWDTRLGLPAGSVEAVVHGIPAWRDAQLGRIGLDAYWEAVRADLGLDQPSLERLRVDFYSGDRLDTDLVSAIRQLRGQSLKTGILSNNTADLAGTLDELDLPRLFDAVVISASIGVMKPDPLAYKAILGQLGVKAGEAVLIDDFADNVAGAQDVGMEGILFSASADWQTELSTLMRSR